LLASENALKHCALSRCSLRTISTESTAWPGARSSGSASSVSWLTSAVSKHDKKNRRATDSASASGGGRSPAVDLHVATQQK